MPIYMIMPRYSRNYALFYQLLDSNSFTHRIMLSWEKPLVKPMAPGSIFHHISFWSIVFCNLYFPIYIIKIPKIFILLSLSDLTFASGHEGIDNPFIALVARFLFVCVGTRRFVCSLLLDWYLGSKKLREILTLLCCITLSSSREKPMQAQDVARWISGAIVGEVFAPVKTYQVPITHSSPSHYIICHLPLIFLSPTSPLSFYSPSLSQSPLSFACLFVCLCVGLIVCHDGSR